MKSDITRNTFKKEKHYNGVRMQQGRVQLDADWNEQVDIQNHRNETEGRDVVGACGVPTDNAGFALLPEGGSIKITKGRIYVDGLLCENEADILFEAQPDFDGLNLPDTPDTYVFYLDVWRRHISAIEDSAIVEAALNGADTATRTKTVWQVKLIPLPGRVPTMNACGTAFDEWDELVGNRNARMMARVNTTAGISSDPCVIPATSGFRGTENQLYRVEIHSTGKAFSANSGGAQIATFKWSRDNGTIAAGISKIVDNDAVTIERPSRDSLLSFSPGDWIEVSDDFHELRGEAGVLARLKSVINGVELVFDPASATGDISNATFFKNPKVRRWDQKIDAEITTTATNWITLEDGVEVKFAAEDSYKTGDYWLIPARTVTGAIEWPVDNEGNPELQDRLGIEHHFCRLAIVSLNPQGIWTLESDCRPFFSPLAEQLNLFYISGDGQQGFSGETLPEPLIVGVTNGLLRIGGARIQFSVAEGDNAKLALQEAGPYSSGPLTVFTVADKDDDEFGLAKVFFRLDEDEDNLSQQVEAVLLDSGGNPVHLPVRFNATVSRAISVGVYDIPDCGNVNNPSVRFLFDTLLPNWPDLDNDGRITVKDILDALLCHLDAEKLPFLHRGGSGLFPTELEQTVAAALNYLSHRSVPTGTVMAFAADTPPEDWLECDGQAIDREEFSGLFDVLGTSFGNGNGLNTFNLPDLRGEFIRGWIHDRTDIPEETGRIFGDPQGDQFQSHTHLDDGHTHNDSGHGHILNDPGHSHSAPTFDGGVGGFEVAPNIQTDFDYINAAPTTSNPTNISINTGQADIQSSNANIGGPAPFDSNGDPRIGSETRPRNIALMYCIKT